MQTPKYGRVVVKLSGEALAGESGSGIDHAKLEAVADQIMSVKALGVEHHFKKGQYSAAYSGFEGIEDNTDRIQTREEVTAEQSAGKTLANALKAAGVTQVDVVGIAESHCVKDTALDAKRLGFDVTVFEDLTVPVSEELGVAARKQMADAGIILAEAR